MKECVPRMNYVHVNALYVLLPIWPKKPLKIENPNEYRRFKIRLQRCLDSFHRY